MPVYLKPTSIIKKDLGIEEGGPAHAYFTHICRVYMDKYVPYSGPSGQRTHLREQVTETVNEIIYELPYAHAQYVGFTTGPVHNYTTPGTGPYWDRLMDTAEGEDVVKKVQEYINTHGGR